MIRLVKLLLACAFAAGLLYLSHGFILMKAGEHLILKDELKPADAIVVLAGEETERVAYGVKLFREKWARKDRLIMAGGPVVWKYTWAGMMKEHAMSLGIPAKQILLEDLSRSTEEDALFTGEILRSQGFTSIILVTSPYHSRRAAGIFRRVLGERIRVISAPVQESWFSPNDWWKRRRDRAMALNEYSKFLWLYFFGLQKEAAPEPGV